MAEATKEPGIISYGLSSYGYDVRLGTEFKLFRPAGHADPKNFSVLMDEFSSNMSRILPSGGYLLGISHEYFRMPQGVLGIAVGKSTYARCGLMINMTPLEPGWQGYLTLELANLAPVPITIYPGEGICQIVFFASNSYPEVDYATRSGRYTNDTQSPQPPTV